MSDLIRDVSRVAVKNTILLLSRSRALSDRGPSRGVGRGVRHGRADRHPVSRSGHAKCARAGGSLSASFSFADPARQVCANREKARAKLGANHQFHKASASLAAAICSTFLISTAPLAAQDVYDTEVLSRHADVERQRQLLKATVGRHGKRTGASPTQRRICADKVRYRSQHGADEPRVRKLYALCAKAGL